MYCSIEDLKNYSVWRHVETNSLCYVHGIARRATKDPTKPKLSVVYFSMEYQYLCYRELNEFLDGRFVPVGAKKS